MKREIHMNLILITRKSNKKTHRAKVEQWTIMAKNGNAKVYTFMHTLCGQRIIFIVILFLFSDFDSNGFLFQGSEG